MKLAQMLVYQFGHQIVPVGVPFVDPCTHTLPKLFAFDINNLTDKRPCLPLVSEMLIQLPIEAMDPIHMKQSDERIFQ